MTRTDPDKTRTDPDKSALSGSRVDPDTDNFSPRRGEVVCPGQTGPTQAVGSRVGQGRSSSGRGCPGHDRSRIDLRDVAARADLRALLDADLGPAKVIGRVPHWCCPFHPDSEPSLYLFADGRRWRCWPCGLTGDALDYLARRDNIGVVEAARLLDPGRGATRDRKPARRPAREPKPAPVGWESPGWQSAVGDLIDQAERNLWGADGRDALEWLRHRGLADHAIRMHRLGYLPDAGWTSPVPRPDGTTGGIHFERGIAVPWVRPGSWYSATTSPKSPDPGARWVGLNVRRLMPDPFEPWPGADKCKALKGSARGYPYPSGDICPEMPALVVEGEPDALLAWQLAGWVVNPITVGGATQTPRPEALATLDACPVWLIATDHDRPGDKAAREFVAKAPDKAFRVWLPHGKDLGEFVQAGGDVLGWLREEFDNLGLPWPLRT